MRAHELAERELEEAEHPPVRDRLLLDAVAALQGDRLVHESAAVLFAPADRRDQRPNGQHLRKAPRVTAVEEDLRRLLDVAFGRIQVAGAPIHFGEPQQHEGAPLLAMPRRRLELLLEQIPCSPEIAAPGVERAQHRARRACRTLRRIGIERDRARHRVRIGSSVQGGDLSERRQILTQYDRIAELLGEGDSLMSTQLRTVRIAAPEGDADREVPEYPGPQHSVIAGVLERALEQRDRDAAILLNGRPELESLGAIRPIAPSASSVSSVSAARSTCHASIR